MTELQWCVRCKRDFVHSVYARGLTTVVRCRRCSRWRRVVLAR